MQINHHVTAGIVAALVAGGSIGADHVLLAPSAPSSWRDWPQVSADRVPALTAALAALHVRLDHVEIVCADPSCQSAARSLSLAFDAMRPAPDVYTSAPLGIVPPGIVVLGQQKLAFAVAAAIYAKINLPASFLSDPRYRPGDITVAFGLPTTQPK